MAAMRLLVIPKAGTWAVSIPLFATNYEYMAKEKLNQAPQYRVIATTEQQAMGVMPSSA